MVASAFAVGLVLWWLVPGLGLAGAVAVGAVVSPPDAVAATSIGKRLGLPPRLVTILEGEGLLNDATALVMLRSAIVATAGAISFGSVLVDFACAVVIAVAIGAVVATIASSSTTTSPSAASRCTTRTANAWSASAGC